KALAKGNGAVFDDIYWQHLAFQQGGVAELEKAAKAGELPADQLAAWRDIAEAKRLRAEAEARGDEDAKKRADVLLWKGNGSLLRHEQEALLQPNVYDKDRKLFKGMSGYMASPIPHAKYFEGNDIGDLDQRWSWIQKDLLPQY